MHHHTINVRVDNHTATLSHPYDYDKLIPYWSHSVENYNHILRARPFYRQCKVCHQYPGKNHDTDHDYIPTWDGRIKYLKRDQLPAGLFWATYKDIEKAEHIKFELTKIIVDTSLESSAWSWLHSEGKYKFQNDCVRKMRRAIIEGRGGLILNATGSGKTRIAAMLASRLDCEVLFIVDQLVLLRQAQKEISNHLHEKVGYVGESKFKLKRVTIATIQTLHLHRKDPKFLKWFKNVEIIVIDEIHEMLNKSNFDVVAIANPLSVFGLTATLGLKKKPIRMKAYSLCGPVIYEYPVQRGMQEGVLSKGICISLQYENSIPDIHKYNQQRAYRKRIVKNGERNYLISKLVKRAVRNGKYVIVVVERLKHLEEISERLNIPHEIVAGTYKGKSIDVHTRFKHKDKFERGDIKCLIVNKVFQKGIDLKRVDLIINATGTPSMNKAIQIFGRGIRIHKNKTGLIAIDISDQDSINKSKNWLHKASYKRIKALKQAGITIKPIIWNEELSSHQILKKSEHWLKKEIYGKV
jgi:superfamily II DNA or RNA helicase